MSGYTGKILWADLSQRICHEESIPEEVYDRNLSGIGLSAHITSLYMPAGADPLGHENILGFVAGILTGSGALFSGRWLVTGKSPLTGGWGDANCGGNFGQAIKQCGYDGIFFKGQADEPVYLYADGDIAEIRSASHLWGKDAAETETELLKTAGSRRELRVACIGTAGEKRSLISGIFNDRGRMAARSGLGALMGSKNLKAVALAGRKTVPFADQAEIRRLSKICSQIVPKEDLRLPAWLLPIVGRFMSTRKNASRSDGLTVLGLMRTWGTCSIEQISVISGDAPIQNWQGSSHDYNSRSIAPDRVAQRELKKYSCYSCPLGCGGISRLSGDFSETHRPEFETISSLGPLLLNHDLDSIFTLNELFNRAGMDSISAGATLAFAIECFDHGLLTDEDTGGLRLSWGDHTAIIHLAKQMIAREGIGDVLADGVAMAARRIGKGAEQFAMHAGGQDLPMHDPKLDPALGVHYILEPTPGRHTIGAGSVYETLRLWTKVSWAPEVPKSYPASTRYIADELKGLKAAACSMAKMLMDGAGLCLFGMYLGVDRIPLFEYLNAATGWEKTPDEYMEIGRRVESQRQMFNIQQGIEPGDIRLPGRVYGDPPLSKGPLKGKQFDVYTMRQNAWRAMGWDAQTGHPKEESL